MKANLGQMEGAPTRSVLRKSGGCRTNRAHTNEISDCEHNSLLPSDHFEKTGPKYEATSVHPSSQWNYYVHLSRVAGVFLWLIGSIRLVDTWLIGAVAGFLSLGLGVGLYHAYALNLLSQGDETAAHLGVEVERVRRWILLATALMIGASVAVSGLIGFVGLIVPHLLRLVIGSDHRVLVPACALFGAAFLMLADTLARTLLAPTELPVGALTSLVGGPLFLVLLRRELRSLS